MVASEREATDSMVLASGMPWSWISDEEGFKVKCLPTRHGTLDFSIKAQGSDSIEIEVGGKLTLPPGGLTLDPPLPPGHAIAPEDSALTVHALPCRMTLRLRALQVETA
jgi:hypothetical protein